MRRAYASPWSLTDVESVLDLGANTGSALSYFAYATPATSMVAVEANPLLIPCLRRTASTLPMAVDVRHLAVASERKESISFVLDPNHRHGRIGADGDDVVKVPCSSLTALLESSGASPPDVLKMDIEGAEHELMASEPESFAAFRYVFAEIHGSRQTGARRLLGATRRTRVRSVPRSGRGSGAALRASARDRVRVDPLERFDHDGPGELALDALPVEGTHRLQPGAVAEQRDQSGRQPARVTRRYADPATAMHEVSRTATIAGDHRPPRRHRLEDRHAERLAVRGQAHQ
jgi:FkbM family methyltransferase